MGLERRSAAFLLNIMAIYHGALPGLQMCEMGNMYVLNTVPRLMQRLGYCADAPDVLAYENLGGTPERLPVAKDLFELLRMRHVSMDWNGKDRALAFDFSKPLNSSRGGVQYMGRCDVVTNFGMIEHVGEGRGTGRAIYAQWKAWQNAQMLMRPGSGIAVHILPLKECFGTPGEFSYEPSFVHSLAHSSRYQVLNMTVVNTDECMRIGFAEQHYCGQVMVAIRRRGNSPFMSFRDFARLPGLHIHPHWLVGRNVAETCLAQLLSHGWTPLRNGRAESRSTLWKSRMVTDCVRPG